MYTKLTRSQLETNAKALGFDPQEPGALVTAAMVSDPEFREKVTRFFFERALSELPPA